MPTPESPTRASAIRETLANAQAPLTFDELLTRAAAIFPMDAKGLKAALDNFRNNDYVTRRLLQQTADGRYAWLSLLVQGAYLKHTLTADELENNELRFEPELAVALFPTRVHHEPVAPCECSLPDGTHVNLNIEQVGQRGWFAVWGTRVEKHFWDWLKTQGAQTGDALMFQIENGTPARCAVSFVALTTRNVQGTHARNELFAETISVFLKPKQNGMRTEDIAARLLALGLYYDPCPPDALEQILEHDPRFRHDRDEWKIATRADHQYSALGLQQDDSFDFLGAAQTHVKRKRPSKKDFVAQIYRFHASFRHNKSLWRRIEICGDQTLWELDKIMRGAFGHDAMDHLSEFYLGTDAEAYRRGLGAHNPFENSSADKWLIGELGLAPGDALSYTYDFGDNIQHVLKVEALVLRERGVQYPRVVEQNKPRYRYCSDCKTEGKREIATWICLDCSNDQGRDVSVCAEHVLSEHESHYAEEIVY